MLLAPLLAWLGFQKLTQNDGDMTGIPGIPASSSSGQNTALLVAGGVGIFLIGRSQRWW